MKQQLHLIVCIAVAVLALFIPLWYAPFLLALLFVLILKKDSPHLLLMHFLIYALICLLYCLIIQSLGSQDLVNRMGALFLGTSSFTLALISSLFYGLSACLGAWCGKAIKGILEHQKH
ncbi:MAG: hypothetical protein IPM92_02765 [Saprospiraceae bacterium]|nr:hypothetical protein [Saprospiraceae bacterium]